MSLDLPPEFLNNRYQTPGFVAALPGLIERMAGRWGLTVERHFPNIAINYVALARRADGTPCVLKISRHLDDTRNEIAALRVWEGRGACRLLEADEASCALLIERLEPGTMLAEVADGGDDDGATRITADVLRQLWRPAPEDAELRPLASWCDAYDRNRAALARGEKGFPAALFQRADALRQELLDSTDEPVVLHGDMHHFNVLRAQRAEWLAIDPKGLAGDRHFDVCQFMRNPQDRTTPERNSRRLDIFCAELGLDRRRAAGWCFVHAMLDACWDYEDGQPWHDAIAEAEERLAI